MTRKKRKPANVVAITAERCMIRTRGSDESYCSTCRRAWDTIDGPPPCGLREGKEDR